MRILLSFFLLLSITACSNHQTSVQQADTADIHYLTILHTNDNHGRFWHNEKGEYGMAAGVGRIPRIPSNR